MSHYRVSFKLEGTVEPEKFRKVLKGLQKSSKIDAVTEIRVDEVKPRGRPGVHVGQVRELLKDSGEAMTANEISEKLDLEKTAVYGVLHRLMKMDEVDWTKGVRDKTKRYQWVDDVEEEEN